MPERSPPSGTAETSDNTRYYEILGVSKDVSEKELERAFRRKAKKFHPDKGGDSEKFNVLREAIDVLKDPHRRRIYDQCIEHALPGRCDVSYVAIGCGNRRRRRLKLGKDVRHPLGISHEEQQNGTTKLFRLSRNVICSKCKGKGSKSSAMVLVTCANCQGSGRKVLIEQLRGRNWRNIYRCSECSGTGKAIDAVDRCPQCKGDKVVQERKVLEVHVEKGMEDGQRIIFPEEADEAPGIITGDVVFVLHLFDPKNPISSESEDDSEEDREEPISTFSVDPEEDGEELSSDYEEEELSSEPEEGYEDSSISDEDSKQDPEERMSPFSEEEDTEEDPNIKFSLWNIFEEDCEEDSDVEFFLWRLFEED